MNACEGARTSRDDPYAGVAQALVQQDIPAVIAMQFAIFEDSAITFAQEFYRSIADGFPVDAAVSEARKAIFTENSEMEWGTPVLFMSSPDGMIFDLRTTTTHPTGPGSAPVKPALFIPGGWIPWLIGTLVFLAISIVALFNFLGNPPASENTPAVIATTSRPTSTPAPPTKTATPSPTPTNTAVPTSTIPFTPTTTPYPANIIDSRGAEMVLIPAGTFPMGNREGPSDENPVRDVYLDAYHIDKYEVSNGVYSNCEGRNICGKPINFGTYNLPDRYYLNPQYDNYPVTFVTWEMANTYCTNWRNGGLLSESEWE